MAEYTVTSTEYQEKKLAWLAGDTEKAATVQAIFDQKLQDHEGGYIQYVNSERTRLLAKAEGEDAATIEAIIEKKRAEEAAEKAAAEAAAEAPVEEKP